jgi:hypothetical protein
MTPQPFRKVPSRGPADSAGCEPADATLDGEAPLPSRGPEEILPPPARRARRTTAAPPPRSS